MYKLDDAHNSTIVGKRLMTKDGRRIGNAFCYGKNEENAFEIETDFGNLVTFSMKEIYSLWWVDDSLEETHTYVQWGECRKKKIKETTI